MGRQHVRRYEFHLFVLRWGRVVEGMSGKEEIVDLHMLDGGEGKGKVVWMSDMERGEGGKEVKKMDLDLDL